MNKTKKRIEFIDLAKGVCIIMVVLVHCGVDIPITGFGMLRMPLYFMLSGLFFRDYGGVLQHTCKKINKILIPFIFFYIIAYIPYYLFEYFKPGLIKTDANGILDLFNNRQFFNGPIWFLLCLFWANLIFCLIKVNICKEYLRGGVVFLIGVMGVLLGKWRIFIPLFVDVAMSALPYLYMGYLLTKTTLLFPNKYDKYNFLVAGCCYFVTFAICQFVGNTYMSFHYNRMNGNILLNYLGSFCCVISIMMICKIIGKLPIVSFCGRYSIIILCLHHMIYRPLKLVVGTFITTQYENLIVAGGTIAICIALIPVCVKYLPWFTAQKDLLNDTFIKRIFA